MFYRRWVVIIVVIVVIVVVYTNNWRHRAKMPLTNSNKKFIKLFT